MILLLFAVNYLYMGEEGSLHRNLNIRPGFLGFPSASAPQEGKNKPSPRATHSPDRARAAYGYEVSGTPTHASRFDLAKSNSPNSLPRPVRIGRQFLSEERK